MFTNQTPSSTQDQLQEQHENDENIREIHALASPPPPPPPYRRRHEPWEPTASHHRSSSPSLTSTESENFSTMSREFSALVLAGTNITQTDQTSEPANLERIREEDVTENNPFAIVAGNNPVVLPTRPAGSMVENASVQRVKKEEVESKISAWQNAKISKINNRFKRDDAIINGWENEQVQMATSWMKKIERKLEAKRARAMEKMHNDIAKARRKSEERRATAEAKRGTKVARVMEVANLMRAVGRAPAKRSFF